MSTTMYADFSDKSCAAIMNGEAIFKNGFRAKKGYFFPEQPTFRPITNTANSEIKTYLYKEAAKMTVSVASFCVYQLFIPLAKEKLYPFLTEKFDMWKEKQFNQKSAEKGTSVQTCTATDTKPETEIDNIIYFDKYKNMA